MPLDTPNVPTPADTGVSAAESTNAANRNQQLSAVIEAISGSSSAAITALQAIAAAITASIIGGVTGAVANAVLVAKGTGGRALQPTPVTIDPATGDINTNGGDLTVTDITAQNGAFALTLTKGGNNLAIVTQSVSSPWLFLFPEDGTFKIIVKATSAFTITETTTITTAGTATVTIQINGTPLGGTANSASTSEQSQAHSSANVVNAGDDVSVVFSSTSSDCENLSLNIAGTQTLAS